MTPPALSDQRWWSQGLNLAFWLLAHPYGSLCCWVWLGQAVGATEQAPECWSLPPGAPLVSMPPRIHGYLHQPLLVSCSVHSALPFRLQLRRKGAKLGEERHFQ